jgi:hypothetical protein
MLRGLIHASGVAGDLGDERVRHPNVVPVIKDNVLGLYLGIGESNRLIACVLDLLLLFGRESGHRGDSYRRDGHIESRKTTGLCDLTACRYDAARRMPWKPLRCLRMPLPCSGFA